MIGIHYEGDLLEGKEADAQRKGDLQQGQTGREQGIEITDKEIHVLKIAQDPQVDQNAPHHQCLCAGPSPVFPKPSVDPVIQQYAGQNDQEVAGVKIPVKPKGHAKEKSLGKAVFMKMVQTKISCHTKGKEQQDKNIRIK